MRPRPRTFTVPRDDEGVAAGLQWIRSATTGDVFTDRAYIRWMLDELAAAQRWPEVIEAARVAQFPMAQGARWGTWEYVLEHALAAARSMTPRDRSTEGWALHQLGSRALVMDDLAQARTKLHSALETREAIGDLEGAAITRENLKILPLAASGLMTLLTVLVGLIALLVPSLDTIDVREETSVLDIAEEVVAFPALRSAGDEPQIHLFNRGTVELSGLLVGTVEGGPVVELVGTACDPLPADGGQCGLVLDMRAVDEQDLPFVITIRYDSAPGASGDDSVLVLLDVP